MLLYNIQKLLEKIGTKFSKNEEMKQSADKQKSDFRGAFPFP